MWKTLAAIVLSTLPLRGCDQYLPMPEEEAASIFRVLHENCAAANAEDVNRYMKTFHPDAPDYESRRFAFEVACRNADLESHLVQMTLFSLEKKEAQVLHIIRTEKLNGPECIEDNVVATQLVKLRKNGDGWQVYATDPIPEGYFILTK